MALFGSILGALSGAGSFLGQVTGALGAVRALSAPSTVSFLPASGPVVGIPQPGPQVMAARMPSPRPSMPGPIGGAIATAGRELTRVIAPILIKIAEATGSTTMTLRRAVRIVRRMGRAIGPASVAIALGLTIEELGTLILADSQRPRRRMNPANVSALRRSMRRIQSFHRLCQKADLLSRPRSRSRKAAAGSGTSARIVNVK